MNIELKKEMISIPTCVYETSCDQSVDLEINLPDYCSDIKRILRCFVVPGISSTGLSGDRASAKGDVTIRLVYIGDNEKIDCFEQSVDLSVFADMKNLPENPVLTAKAKTMFVNCRATSQRRFIVGSSVSVNFSVYCSRTDYICSKGENETIETLESSLRAISQSAVSQKMFDLSETIALDENKEPVGRIIGCEPSVHIDSFKTVSGKILIKGDLMCQLTYCADTAEKSVTKLNHTMPISQIIEIPGVDDTFETQICVEPCSVAINTKADSSGKNMLVELAVKLNSLVVGTKESDISFVTDCYCTKFESKADYKSFDFKKSVGNLKTVKNISCALDLPEQNVKNILQTKIISVSQNCNASGMKLEGKGTVLFGMIFEDKKDKIQYIERNTDFSFDCDLSQSCEKVSCNPIIALKNITASVGGSKVNLNFEAEITGNVYSVITKKVLENVDVDESREKNLNDAAVTVYYCSRGEQLWDIAKRYNTSKKLIADENSIADETISQDRMLIIPCL